MTKYTTKQVADIIGVHKNTILNWIKRGKISDVQRDWKNHRMWRKEDIDKLYEIKNNYFQISISYDKKLLNNKNCLHKEKIINDGGKEL